MRAMKPRARAALAKVALALSACAEPVAPVGGAPAPALSIQPDPAAVSRGPAAPAPRVVTGTLRFLLIGGGAAPESTEVSLERDIEILQRSLPPPGLTLFAGGSGSESVRELNPAPKGDPVMLALGDLFAPRAGRQSRYRAVGFSSERATLENVEARLSAALSDGDRPLLVHIAAHGDQGSEAKENSVVLWGGGALTVRRLAALHEQHRRPLRLVATSCFSGGFAELAFAHADASAGPSSVPRCGLFAGTFDRETSGCDPNPDHRAQESYSVHFAHALAGTRKDGTPLPPGGADFDGDGKVGLLDAHTWARIEAVSFDVPTTTSERWLRSVEARSAPIDKAIVPEDARVVERLGAALGLTDEGAVKKRWNELDRRITELEVALEAADRALATREAEEATALLERWPVLDDPFHPDFAQTFSQNRGALETALADSPRSRARAEASARVQALSDDLARIGVEEARVLRLLRAYETLHKASALMQRGGRRAEYYASLLACERGEP